jgi:hypothetical protein
MGARVSEVAVESLIVAANPGGALRDSAVEVATLLTATNPGGALRVSAVEVATLLSLATYRSIPTTATLARLRVVSPVTTALKATATRSIPATITLGHYTRVITPVSVVLVASHSRAIVVNAALTTTHTRSIMSVSAALRRKKHGPSRTKRAWQHRIVAILGRRSIRSWR